MAEELGVWMGQGLAVFYGTGTGWESRDGTGRELLAGRVYVALAELAGGVFLATLEGEPMERAYLES